MLWGKVRTYREGLKKLHLFTMKFLSRLWGLGRRIALGLGWGKNHLGRGNRVCGRGEGGREKERETICFRYTIICYLFYFHRSVLLCSDCLSHLQIKSCSYNERQLNLVLATLLLSLP